MIKQRQQSKAIVAALCGVVALGVGYADITNVSFTAQGKSAVRQAPFKVVYGELNTTTTHFVRYCNSSGQCDTDSGVSGVDSDGYYTFINTETNRKNNATVKTKRESDTSYIINVSNLEAGQQVDIAVPVVNNSPSKAVVSSELTVETGANGEYLQHSASFDGGAGFKKLTDEVTDEDGMTYTAGTYYLPENEQGVFFLSIKAVKESAVAVREQEFKVTFTTNPADFTVN